MRNIILLCLLASMSYGVTERLGTLGRSNWVVTSESDPVFSAWTNSYLSNAVTNNGVILNGVPLGNGTNITVTAENSVTNNGFMINSVPVGNGSNVQITVGSSAFATNALLATNAVTVTGTQSNLIATALQPSQTNGWVVSSHDSLYPRSNPSNYITIGEVPSQTTQLYVATAGTIIGSQSNLIDIAQTNYIGPLASGLSTGSNYSMQVANNASNGAISVISTSMSTQMVGSATTVTGSQSNTIVQLTLHAITQSNINNAVSIGMGVITTSVIAANTTGAIHTTQIATQEAFRVASTVNYATNAGNALTVNGLTSTQIMSQATNAFALRSWVLGFSNAPASYNSADATLDVTMPDGTTGQMFEELWMPIKNTSGVPLTNGVCVRVEDASGALSGVRLVACTDTWDQVLGTIGLSTMTTATPLNGDGKITTFGNVNDLDTTAFIEGSNLWLSATPGQLTMAKPTAAGCKQILVGKCLRSHANQGRISVGVRIIPRPDDIGAVATNDARYLATLTNAAAFDPAGTASVVFAALTVHTNRTDNPHATTASQVGADASGTAAGLVAPLTAHAVAQTNINSAVSIGMGALTSSVSSISSTQATVTAQLAGRSNAWDAAAIHTNRMDNPHAVTAAQINAVTNNGVVINGITLGNGTNITITSGTANAVTNRGALVLGSYVTNGANIDFQVALWSNPVTQASILTADQATNIAQTVVSAFGAPTYCLTNTVVVSNSLDFNIPISGNNIRVRWMAMFLSATNETATSKRAAFSMFTRSDRLCDSAIYSDTNQLYWAAPSSSAQAAGVATGTVADASGVVAYDRYAVGNGSRWDFLTATGTTATIIYYGCTNKYATTATADTKISHANYLTPVFYDDDSGQSNIWCRFAWTTPYTGTVSTVMRYSK